MRASSFAFLISCVFVMSGCFDVSPADGVLRCNPNGKACPDGYLCASNNTCVKADGTTIDLASSNTDLMSSTDLTPGTKALGDQCRSADECASGFCADGVCCNTACTGQCEACDIGGAQGTCTTLPSGGIPHNTRPACTGSGTAPCGGQCDGVSSSCAYPPNTTTCGANCDGKCDGAGTCNATGGVCPNGYACGTGGCKTSCSSPGDCQVNFACISNACQRVPESDCLDGADNNGDGLVDCQDPTCTTVACVPEAGANVIGNITSGPCGAFGYNAAVTERAGLVDNGCTNNCGCQTRVDCNSTRTMYTSSATCGGGTSYNFNSAAATQPCVTIPLTTYNSTIGSTNGSPTAQSCTNYGSATGNAPTFTSTTNFCPTSRRSNSCGAGQVCVGKPATGTMCVQLPLGSNCPSNYNATKTNYFTGANAPSCSCSTCSVTSASCANGHQEMLFYKDTTCGTIYAYENVCTANTCCTTLINLSLACGANCPLNGQAIGSMRMDATSGRGTGSCSTNVQVVTPATGTGGSTICCR